MTHYKCREIPGDKSQQRATNQITIFGKPHPGVGVSENVRCFEEEMHFQASMHQTEKTLKSAIR